MRNDCIFCGPILIDKIDCEIAKLSDKRNFEFGGAGAGSGGSMENSNWKYEDKSNLLGADLEWEIR